ncbi:MAG: 23S rRNA (guanosine(2251)-2'-O)-methyltransferase RlmB [Candidatus Lindowbacteria bacterium]|nr:23S rRNA (guanosine(2251)-2'-O)-methyltransferase RlmB [Candidatus Lindowbacteria bacterium]
MRNMEDTGYVYGRRSVAETLRSSPDRVNKLFIAEGAHGPAIDEIRELAKRHRVVTKFLPKQAIGKYAPEAVHQGVVASVTPVDYADADDVIQSSKGGKPALILVLDGITDPQNFGAILRTAEAAGVGGVIIPRHRSVALTSVVAKHSAGAVEYVPVARVVNIAMTIDNLKEKDIRTVGTSDDAERTIYEIDFALPTAILVGSEGEGLRPLVRSKCDEIARIPMLGRISSLNASVAAAVVLYEAVRQRTGGSPTRSMSANPP